MSTLIEDKHTQVTLITCHSSEKEEMERGSFHRDRVMPHEEDDRWCI